jgi:opacity protein-like surface antigen
MKKFFVLPLILLLFVATTALAQMEPAGSMWTIGANVGYGLPMGDFKDGYDGALTVGGDACYMFTGKYGLELAAQWSKFPANADLVDALELLAGESVDANFQFMPVMVDFVAMFPMNAPVTPYLKGGVGMYFETAEVEIGGEKDSVSENDFGVNIGAGMKYAIAETTAIDIGARFHNVMTENQSTQYFTISAGVGFTF